MPASKQDKILVACPHCGQTQSEPRTAFSTVCKKCGGHFRVQEALKPARKTAGPSLQRRKIVCFDCGAELEVAASAESTMCKRCSHYVDLKDYYINNAVSKNFKTKGTFVVDSAGYVFNTEAVVGDAVIKGRFLGRLVSEGSLTLHSTADIKGAFTAVRLIIPVTNHFRWKDPISVGSAEVAGELTASLRATDTVILKATARMFGDLEAKNLIVEAGAVVVGHMRIGSKKGSLT